MKFLLLCFSLVFLSNCTPLEKRPIIAIEKSNIEVGEIKFNQTTQIHFKIYNRGNSNLIIDTISASCDCTVPGFVKKTIAPQDSTILNVSYTPVNPGDFKKAVIIKSNIDSVFTVLKFYGNAVKN